MLQRRALLPSDTKSFARRFRHFRLPVPWFHDIWYDAYDDPEMTRLYVQGPREHAKTSTVLTYLERRLAEDKHLRVGIVSGTDPLAIKFLSELKNDFEHNDELIEAYTAGRGFIGDRWTDHELVLRGARSGPGRIPGKDVSVFAVGRGGQISSRHCDILVVDDVESAESVRTDLSREATRQWWARELVPVLSPGGKLIVAGTRKHFDDLYARFKPEVGWKVLDKARRVWREPGAIGDGTPIWEDMWSAEALRARKAELDENDVLAWAQEYLNEPRPAESQMLYPERWPVYHKAPQGLTILQAWDLAISERTEADYTVGWTIGVNENNDVFLLERRRGHWDFNRTLAEIAEMGTKWAGVELVGIEKVAYQAAAIQEALRRTMLPIVPIDVSKDKDKVTRARLLEARAAANKVYRPAEAEWWQSFADEAVYFPYGAHDDQVDALAHAVRLAGSGTSVISWQYGVWKCVHCAHMFMWEAERPCPKCGTKAPPTFDNPETLAYGMVNQ